MEALVKPPWLKKRLNLHDLAPVVQVQKRLSLNTVCESAQCPNRSECHARKIATFMINGNVCTRACGFCDVQTGRGIPIDPKEADHVAEAVNELGLRHAVITCVARDDLPDGGADGFVRVIAAIRERCPKVTIEVLTSDFLGNQTAITSVIVASPDIYNYNIETVRRLTPHVRRVATYDRTLWLLRYVKEAAPQMYTKSGLMVGFGESGKEVEDTLRDLKAAGVNIVTIGQYLRPGPKHLPVVEYVHPDRFVEYEHFARTIGFSHVASGPYVRSSYLAEDLVLTANLFGHSKTLKNPV